LVKRYNKLKIIQNSLQFNKLLFLFLIIFCVLAIRTEMIYGAVFDLSNPSYSKARDFKAVAQAYQNDKPYLKNGEPVFSYAVKYDTARDAAKASMAYCKRLIHKNLKNIKIEVIALGNIPVKNQGTLDQLIKKYQEYVEKFLKTEFTKTGERDLVTRLSTTLQKTGEYKKSEDLLIDLAMEGEILAQNALAYHWAELGKNLPMALSFVNNAVKNDPDFFSFHDTRALVLFRLGREKDALNASVRSVSLKPHHIALDHYGDILWETGNRAQAVKQWENAIANTKDIVFIYRVALKIKNGKTQDIIFE